MARQGGGSQMREFDLNFSSTSAFQRSSYSHGFSCMHHRVSSSAGNFSIEEQREEENFGGPAFDEAFLAVYNLQI